VPARIIQAARGEIGIDGAEEAFAEVVGFERSTEFQERGGIGQPIGGQINAGVSPHRLTVVEGVFKGFVGQAIPWPEEIHPQHALQSDGRATAFSLRIEGFKNGQQAQPWDDFFHAREEFLAAGDLLFIGELGL
jgi:hypothetical protein